MKVQERIKALRARISARLQEVRGIRTEAEEGATPRTMNEAESAQYAAGLEELEGLRSQLLQLEREASLDGFMGSGAPEDRGAPALEVGDDGGTAAAAETREVFHYMGQEYGPCRYRNFGEQLQAVAAGRTQELREMNLIDGSSGGVLVHPVFHTELLMESPEDEIVMPRSMNIPAGASPDASDSWPAMDQGAAGVHGGMEFHWTEEGGEPDDTDVTLSEVQLNPHEVVGLLIVSNKLLRNAGQMNAFLVGLMQKAIRDMRDKVFLSGDGVGKPRGVLNSPGRIVVSRTTSNTVKYADIVALEQAMNPQSLDRAIFVSSHSNLSTYRTLKDDASHYIFGDRDISKGRPATLHGRPIVYTGKVPPKGSEGDLSLIDFSYYMTKAGYGPVISLSEHVHFKNNKTVFKIVHSLDGNSWTKAPLMLEDGVTEVARQVVLQ